MIDPIQLLQRLVAIDSVNPDLVPGAAGEARIAGFCAAWLDRRGLDVVRLEDRPGRPSVVGVAKGSGGGRSLMFNGHVDTVTLAGYDGDPLDPRIAQGRLFGRGSFDMKNGVAAMMAAAARAAQRRLRGDVIVACVADEEYASHGSEEVVRHFRADAAVVTEPSHLELTLAHKGFVWFDVCIEGRAAHGSRPDLGVDAIAKAGHFLAALEALDRQLRTQPTHPILHSGSVHASMIKGGLERSSYPAECQIALERRTIPGETAEVVEAELLAILERLTQSVPHFHYRLTRRLARQPFEAAPNEPIVAILAYHAARVLGHPPKVRGEPFWTDCAILKAAGIPCLMFGADGGGAHAASEWTTVSSVLALSDILFETACAFCG